MDSKELESIEKLLEIIAESLNDMNETLIGVRRDLGEVIETLKERSEDQE